MRCAADGLAERVERFRSSFLAHAPFALALEQGTELRVEHVRFIFCGFQCDCYRKELGMGLVGCAFLHWNRAASCSRSTCSFY